MIHISIQKQLNSKTCSTSKRLNICTSSNRISIKNFFYYSVQLGLSTRIP